MVKLRWWMSPRNLTMKKRKSFHGKLSIQVGNTGGTNNEAAAAMINKFWDSAMQLGSTDDEEDTSEGSMKVASVGGETGRSFPSPMQLNTFAFKIEDRMGRKHRFICDTRSLIDLTTCILQRVGDDVDGKNLPQILYEDEDHDKVVLASDSDLAAAVDHARLAGWKGLRLHLDYSRSHKSGKTSTFSSLDHAQSWSWTATHSGVAAGAVLIVSLGVIGYLKRSGSLDH
ncbi:hypothetical protein Nepgr_002982 [Nepenthes gracilis]|uniref:PB1 domain-containing protein n=1 Tax=Nepenthes gracilis TaxID=150966 RepID=A0AAD3RYN7_NEPGR|nr:hypothetical protein Nepgr_002982 [Nepenthes gracilis]